MLEKNNLKVDKNNKNVKCMFEKNHLHVEKYPLTVVKIIVEKDPAYV